MNRVNFSNKDLTDFVRLGEHFLEGKAIKVVTPSESNIVKKRDPRIGFDKDGKINFINISYSLMSRMLYKGEPKPICPKRFYHTHLICDIIEPSTLSQDKGKYFEYKCIGASNYDDIVLDLPVHKKTGRKLIDTIRIDAAVDRFKEQSEKYGMVIDKNYVQYKTNRIWIDKKKMISTDIHIIVSVTIDFISPITWEQYNYPAAVFDLKLTGDRDGCYPPFCWGDPKQMDLIQGILYSSVTGMPFFFYVFDYRAHNPGHKLIPIKTIATHPNDPDAINRENELDQNIRWSVAAILDMEANGWKEDPADNNCKECPLYDCKARHRIEAA